MLVLSKTFTSTKERQDMASDNLVLYVAAYSDATSAKADFESLKSAEGADLSVEAAVVMSRDADGNVDVLFQQVGIAVAQGEPHVDVGILCQVLGDDRQHVQAPEDERCRHDQFTARTGVNARGGAIGRRIHWDTVERLRPYGGIRIEDDVACTPGEPENLTRDAFARN